MAAAIRKTPAISGCCCKNAAYSGLRKTLDYSLKRWSALLHYLDDGRVPIDNNRAENYISPVAVGRKNCLFAVRLQLGCILIKI
ncbi:Transposase IS66 family [Yersinia wautersii]|uniref:Transposase IS66 family n=1 Tax=Yersinia wautersii TaxID=1341643 RepID=A0ABM9TGY5_9GAMM|nr:Transposase IS66 family [Yersinia wautersii]